MLIRTKIQLWYLVTVFRGAGFVESKKHFDSFVDIFQEIILVIDFT